MIWHSPWPSAAAAWGVFACLAMCNRYAVKSIVKRLPQLWSKTCQYSDGKTESHLLLQVCISLEQRYDKGKALNLAL